MVCRRYRRVHTFLVFDPSPFRAESHRKAHRRHQPRSHDPALDHRSIEFDVGEAFEQSGHRDPQLQSSEMLPDAHVLTETEREVAIALAVGDEIVGLLGLVWVAVRGGIVQQQAGAGLEVEAPTFVSSTTVRANIDKGLVRRKLSSITRASASPPPSAAARASS